METCGQCVIYSPNMYGAGCHGCGVREYEGEVRPDTPACGRYIGRKELLESYTQARRISRPDNSSALPVARYWARHRDVLSGKMIGYVSYCPSCRQMIFAQNACENCGQPFLGDCRSADPAAWQTCDCPFCHAAGAYRYSDDLNGIGYCEACGASVLDFNLCVLRKTDAG